MTPFTFTLQRPNWNRSGLCLETLEARCVPSTVTNLNDNGPGSLRDAIATSPEGGTVDFQPGLTGTITLTTGELAINKDLTIDGPGTSVITVSGNHASRVFNIGNFAVAISGLAIANGAVTDGSGGGISNAGPLTVTDCIFSRNEAMADTNGDNVPSAGGIYNAGTLAITRCAFGGNIAQTAGGGIGGSGILTVTGCTFSGNLAQGGGGGIATQFGTATVSRSTFSSDAASSGGGISSGGYGDTLIVTDCTFSGNKAYGNEPDIAEGGGIADTEGKLLIIVDSTFSGNDAFDPGFGGGDGGGIFDQGSTVIVTGSTFSGNVVSPPFPISGDGGGIENYYGTLIVADSTFSGNFAGIGGGIENYSTPFSASILQIRNTLVAGNSSQTGGPDVDGPLTSLGHNLIGIGKGGSDYVATDLVGTATSPINPMLGPLQDNGGPTPTLALLPGSPAIGAGALTDSEWDQRGPGYARTINGMTDIGAYEVQASLSAALTLRFPEPTLVAAVLALSSPISPIVPLRPAAATLDGVFGSWTDEAAGLLLGRSRHAALGEPGFWPFDCMPAV
jgi:hypothetical protein